MPDFKILATGERVASQEARASLILLLIGEKQLQTGERYLFQKIKKSGNRFFSQVNLFLKKNTFFWNPRQDVI